MPLAKLLWIAGAMSAPSFFLVFAFAALGAPFLALICLAAAQLRSTHHPEAYARRLLRMALTCALPAALALAGGLGLTALRTPWLLDWLRAAPLGPALFAVAVLAYCASLLTLRLSRHSHRHRPASPLGPALVLCVLALALLWLGAALGASLQEQAQAVLAAPSEGGIGVARLVLPDASALPFLSWTALAALVALCMACAGTAALQYLMLLRDREPFGRETLGHMLRLSARATLRSSLLAGAFLPVLWLHLPDMPALPEGQLGAQLMLAASGACCLLLCLCAGIVARSTRPWERGLTIHLCLLLVWAGLTGLLSNALLCFYAV